MSTLTAVAIDAFSGLGAIFRKVSGETNALSTTSDSPWNRRFETAIEKARLENPWFTDQYIRMAMGPWGALLEPTTLANWINQYGEPHGPPKRVALILAGNIPMVGFHDLLAVLCTGHTALLKFASKDSILLSEVASYLSEEYPLLAPRIEKVTSTLGQFDAVIATGSNNTGRYFQYYFGQKPHIIRKNRTGIAVLDGQESPEELTALGDDVFRYFGLGCRNVSKIYLPEGLPIAEVIARWEAHKKVLNHHKYANNYHYQKSVWLMNGAAFTDGGFVLAKEDSALFAPLATVYFESYKNFAELKNHLTEFKDDIQCVVSHSPITGAVPFGQAQQPGLDDYADGVDTVEFLLKT